MSELLVPAFWSNVLIVVSGRMPLAQGMAAYTYEMDTEHFVNLTLSVVAANDDF